MLFANIHDIKYHCFWVSFCTKTSPATGNWHIFLNFLFNYFYGNWSTSEIYWKPPVNLWYQSVSSILTSRDVASIPTNIEDGRLCKNSEHLLANNYFAKLSILNAFRGFRYARYQKFWILDSLLILYFSFLFFIADFFWLLTNFNLRSISSMHRVTELFPSLKVTSDEK